MSDNKIIFSMAGVSKIYPPKKQVLKNIYLSFFYGAKIGVLGLNGSGKSSLLRIIAGMDKDYQGEVVFSPGFSVGMLEQEPDLDMTKTVKEIVQEGAQETVDLLNEFEEINLKFADPGILADPDAMNKLIEDQGKVQEKLDQVNAWDLDSRLDRAMDALRTPPADAPVKNLSGGEKRRVALCRLLIQEPDVLLLDEPTNHLDAESVHWLEQHLRQYKGTVIAVTHDRYFLDNVAGWILELDRGEGIPWEGNYSSWLDQKQKRLSDEEKTESKRQKTLQRELEWVRMSPKARQSKSKARLGAYDKLVGQEAMEKEQKLELYIPAGPRLGTKVIEAKGVSKAFGDKLLYDNLEFNLPQAGIVGIIGPNGAGKTNILEAVSLLSPGRGLRRSSAEDMARRPEAVGWKVSGVLRSLAQVHEVETWSENGAARQISIDSKSANQVALGRIARVLWLIPSMDRLWIEGPEGRRRFLDRLTLSFTPSHAESSLAYEKAMRERNRLLKDQVREPSWYAALETQMASAGAQIHANRTAALEVLAQAQNDAQTSFPTAVLDLTQTEGEMPDTEEDLRDALAEKTRRAMKMLIEAGLPEGGRRLAVAGGVAANGAIRGALQAACDDLGFEFSAPPLALCTDNAAMIAWAGAEHWAMGERGGTIAARPRWPLDPDATPMLGGGKKGPRA